MCEIANKIKARRLELKLTLEDVATAVGVGRSTVQRWESGMIKNMGRDKIAALANILQLDPVELVPSPLSLLYGAKAVSEGFYIAHKKTDDDYRLEALHENPKLGMLFDRTRKMSQDDVDFMIQMADRILKERDGD